MWVTGQGHTAGETQTLQTAFSEGSDLSRLPPPLQLWPLPVSTHEPGGQPQAGQGPLAPHPRLPRETLTAARLLTWGTDLIH